MSSDVTKLGKRFMALERSDINKLRGDLSPFLIHLTRTGSYKQWKDIHNLSQDNYPTITAKDSLESIVSNNKIEARVPFGYFNYSVPYNGKDTNSNIKRDWLRSVCFTETPLDHIHVQFQRIKGRSLQFESYGLAFFEASIRSNGGSPVMYFDTSNNSIRLSLDAIPPSNICTSLKPLLPLYEGFGPPLYKRANSPKEIDFRWEREWRIVDDFNFSSVNDVAFGICPSSQIDYFEKLVSNSFPFIDPQPQFIDEMKLKLKGVKRLESLV